MDDRPFGRSKITVEERNFRSLSKWTAHIRTFRHSPFLRCRVHHLDGSKSMYTYRPNGRYFFVNLDKRPFSQSKIMLVGCNFGPSECKVVECNFGSSKITVLDSNFGPSKWSKWLTYIRKFGPASNWAVQCYSCWL